MKLLVLLSVLFVSPLFSQQSFWEKLPDPIGFVNDFENILTLKEEKELNKLITDYEKKSTVEIAIVTIPTSATSKEKFDDLSLYIAKTWGVGKKVKNNGILIAISDGYSKVRIQNGLGIEQIISDEATKKVIDEEMIPFFKKDNFYKGLVSGVNTITELLDVYFEKTVSSCKCPYEQGSNGVQKPISVYTFSNGTSICICEFHEYISEEYYISDFSIADCKSEKILYEYGKYEDCKVVQKKDTLLIVEYKYLPVLPNFGLDKVKIAVHKIYSLNDTIISEIKLELDKLNLSQTIIDDFLNTFSNDKINPVDRNIETEILLLELLTLHQNDKAYEILQNYESYIGMKVNVGVARDVLKNAKRTVRRLLYK